MCEHWAALQESLTRFINTLEAHRQFVSVKDGASELEPFAAAESVVRFLTDRTSCMSGKDRVLRALVRLVQSRQERRLAAALLWLGLSPGLEAAHRAALRGSREDPREVLSSVFTTFTELVERISLGIVQSLAATLVMNTRRDVLRELRRRRLEQQRSTSSVDLESIPPQEAAGLGPAHGSPDVSELHAWLASAVGRDADLLIAVVVLEVGYENLPQALGLSSATARQRLHRALEKIRRALADDASQRPRWNGLCDSRGRRSPQGVSPCNWQN
jgi:DNA-directed RNA polymerase specialized sigma24 family protein